MQLTAADDANAPFAVPRSSIVHVNVLQFDGKCASHDGAFEFAMAALEVEFSLKNCKLFNYNCSICISAAAPSSPIGFICG